jgi:hypothetical protein
MVSSGKEGRTGSGYETGGTKGEGALMKPRDGQMERTS